MQKSYPAYRPVREQDFKKIWRTCIFAFDASALLDLYRVTVSTREEYLSALEKFKARLFLPHQAGLEYHRNRLSVISDGQSAGKRIRDAASEASNQFRKGLDELRQYQWVQVDTILVSARDFIQTVDTLTAEASPMLAGFEKVDPVLTVVTRLFSGKVGKPYKDMHSVYTKAALRLDLHIPPGYKDLGSKKDFRKYGDVVLWFQLLDIAAEEKKPIVFITSDSKSDWWQSGSGKTFGPRAELVQEMFATAGVQFHIYTPHRFLEYAQEFLQLQEAEALKAAVELQQVEKEKAAESSRRRDLLKLLQADRNQARRSEGNSAVNFADFLSGASARPVNLAKLLLKPEVPLSPLAKLAAPSGARSSHTSSPISNNYLLDLLTRTKKNQNT